MTKRCSPNPSLRASSAKDFASAIREGTKPRSSARLGLEVVLGLEALERSLHSGGAPVKVRSVEDARAAGRPVHA